MSKYIPVQNDMWLKQINSNLIINDSKKIYFNYKCNVWPDVLFQESINSQNHIRIKINDGIYEVPFDNSKVQRVWLNQSTYANLCIHLELAQNLNSLIKSNRTYFFLIWYVFSYFESCFNFFVIKSIVLEVIGCKINL